MYVYTKFHIVFTFLHKIDFNKCLRIFITICFSRVNLK